MKTHPAAMVMAAIPVLLAVSCSNGNGTTRQLREPPQISSEGVPRIVDCDSIEFDGQTYDTECPQGVRSFVVAFHGDKPGCFEITCSEGCIKSATPCEKKKPH